MSKDYWRVEEKILPNKAAIREEYIKLLERVIENLKKTRNTNMELDAKGRKESLFDYSIPTIIFAELTDDPISDYVTAKLHCYRDMKAFYPIWEILDSGAEIE